MQAENGNGSIVVKGTCGGYSIKGTYDVQMKVVLSDAYVATAFQLIVGISQKLHIACEIGEEVVPIGAWNVYRYTVDRNAQTTIVFKSTTEDVPTDELTRLMVEDQEITFTAVEGD